MQTVQRAQSSVRQVGVELSSPLRREGRSADAALLSGFQPVRPRTAPLSKLPRSASLATNLRAASATRGAQAVPEAPAGFHTDQGWCSVQDSYTQDDDDAGWF